MATRRGIDDRLTDDTQVKRLEDAEGKPVDGSYRCLAEYELEVTEAETSLNDVDSLKKDLLTIRDLFNKRVSELWSVCSQTCEADFSNDSALRSSVSSRWPLAN